MLRALGERGVRPDLIVGSSVGALHGALLADQPDRAVERMLELWERIDRRALFGRRRTVVRSLVRHRAVSDGTPLAALIADALSTDDFAALSTPFAAVATDAMTGEPVLLTEGSIGRALMASAAVPGVFPPVDIDGRAFVDGGVAANVPLRQALAFGAMSALVLDVQPPTYATRLPTSIPGGLAHATALMLKSQWSGATDDLDPRYRVERLPSATPPDMGTFNFARTAELLEASYELTMRTLDEWVGGPPEVEDSSSATSDPPDHPG